MTINEFFIEANSDSIAKIDLNFKRISKNYLPRYSFLRTSAISSGDSLHPSDNSGYTKIEDKFVDAYLTREGESVEQAKERLKEEKNQK